MSVGTPPTRSLSLWHSHLLTPFPLTRCRLRLPVPVGLAQGLHIDVGLLALDFIRPCWGCADGANAVELQFTAQGPQVRLLVPSAGRPYH